MQYDGTQNTNSYLIGPMYPYTLEVSEDISSNSQQIVRQATLLFKLVNMLNNPDPPSHHFNHRLYRIGEKLDKELDLWALYRERETMEHDELTSMLEKTIDHRKMLHIKRELGEISIEEFTLKLSVADWDIQDLKDKRHTKNKSVNALNNIRRLFDPGDISLFYLISKDNYRFLKNLDLDSELTAFLASVLSKFSNVITYKNPSTL